MEIIEPIYPQHSRYTWDCELVLA